MEQLISPLELSDYRAFLTHYDRRHIRKVEVAGPDITSVLPKFREEMARIARPDTVLLSVWMPSAEHIVYKDLILLLECVICGNNNPNVRWGIREQADVPVVRGVAYVGVLND